MLQREHQHTVDAVAGYLNGSIPEDGLRLAIDLGKKDSKIAREVPPGEVADLSFFREVQKELGVR